MKPDGSVLFRPSGEADPRFAVSLRTANAGVGAEKAGVSLALPQGEGGAALQGSDHGRELLGGVCAVVVAVAAVVAVVTAVIALIVEVTKEDEPPTPPIIINITIEQNGEGEITIPIDPDYLNDDGTDICDTCGIDIEASDCVENCEGYDMDATNSGLQTTILEVYYNIYRERNFVPTR